MMLMMMHLVLQGLLIRIVRRDMLKIYKTVLIRTVDNDVVVLAIAAVDHLDISEL